MLPALTEVALAMLPARLFREELEDAAMAAELELCCWREELASAALLLLLVWIAVLETLADEAETFVTFFLTTTSLSTSLTSLDFDSAAAAKTLCWLLKLLRQDSASSALDSADSNSLWNFLTLMMLELEMDSCSSSCLLYILIFSFRLSRDSCRIRMFFLSSSDWRSSSLTDLSFLCRMVVVSTCIFFSFSRYISNSSILASILAMVLLLEVTAVVSSSSMRMEARIEEIETTAVTSSKR